MELFVFCFVSGLIGLVVGIIIMWPFKTDGKLVMDETNPEKDIYRLELTIPIDEIPSRKTITLTVARLRN